MAGRRKLSLIRLRNNKEIWNDCKIAIPRNKRGPIHIRLKVFQQRKNIPRTGCPPDLRPVPARPAAGLNPKTLETTPGQSTYIFGGDTQIAHTEAVQSGTIRITIALATPH